MPEGLTFTERLKYAWKQLGAVGKPLFVGLAILATVSGITIYFLVHWIWLVRVRIARWRRIRKMRYPDSSF